MLRRLRPTGPLRTVGAALALALAGATTGAGAAEAVPTRPTAPLVWTDCPADPSGAPVDPRLRCTTLKVPLDYREPRGRTVEIAVSRLPTAKPGLRRGILVHNGGGPGVASLHLPSAQESGYPQEVLDRYDLVGFDPRGVGRSTPVSCGRTAAEVPYELVFPFPAPDGSIAPNVRFARDLARDCLARNGDRIRHLTTANTARDLDRIRAALGEPRISYRAASYGTYLGVVYAELFPGRTDRFVLDGSVSPNVTWQDRLAGWDRASELRFEDFARWAAERDSTLRFGATPAAVRANYLALAAELDRTPVVHPVAGPVNGNLWRTLYRLDSYHTALFQEIADWWRFLADGGAGPVPYWWLAKGTPGIPEDNDVAALTAVLCGDTPAPRDLGHYRRAVAESRLRNPIVAGMGANIWPCAFWPDPVEPAVRITDRGPANILLLQTERDPATPLTGALEMRATLGERARMVTVDGGNHGAYDRSTPSCAVAAADRFLATGTLPARDLGCAPDPVPAAG
ncbi:alpha/beta hydrolase [Kitasatospora purpeofusca]|uniref:alpha/beta hydrolase n=1 Tax=Kitasatospora purpeofusca TaxID=67352 RepID=UPI00068E52AE|nr:alpha/beta hydrolase [Kitasatospora purpeofusca]